MQASYDVEYLIIGAGFSGLAMAYHLQKGGENSIRILERSDGLGGTWYANTYPGCACDVPAHVYSYSFEQKPDWSKLFANQPEILKYIKSVAAKHDLEKYITYNKTVSSLSFDESSSCWNIQTADGEMVTARFVIAAAGPLATPAMPDIEGIADFAGELFHSAEWRHDLELSGKRVAVIGTGASAIQFVPEIANKVGKLLVFQRTAPWVLPRMERAFTEGELQTLRERRSVSRLLRWWLYWRSEMRAMGFFRYPGLLRIFEWMGKRHLKKQVTDEKLRAVLMPNFRFGCKRLLMSNDWYPAITGDNAELLTDPIKKIVPSGVALQDGRLIEADVIIMGTGFHATEPMPGIEVRGRSGLRLHQHWSENGIDAYYGSTVSRFPNLFMLLGPNTGLGHNSVVYMAEAQIEGIVRLISEAKRAGAASIEVKQEIQAAFNEDLQQRMTHSVWQTGGCDSWYKTEEGSNTTIWPGYTFDFRKKATNLALADFEITENYSRDKQKAQAAE